MKIETWKTLSTNDKKTIFNALKNARVCAVENNDDNIDTIQLVIEGEDIRLKLQVPRYGSAIEMLITPRMIFTVIEGNSKIPMFEKFKTELMNPGLQENDSSAQEKWAIDQVLMETKRKLEKWLEPMPSDVQDEIRARMKHQEVLRFKIRNQEGREIPTNVGSWEEKWLTLDEVEKRVEALKNPKKDGSELAINSEEPF